MGAHLLLYHFIDCSHLRAERRLMDYCTISKHRQAAWTAGAGEECARACGTTRPNACTMGTRPSVSRRSAVCPRSTRRCEATRRCAKHSQKPRAPPQNSSTASGAYAPPRLVKVRAVASSLFGDGVQPPARPHESAIFTSLYVSDRMRLYCLPGVSCSASPVAVPCQAGLPAGRAPW